MTYCNRCLFLKVALLREIEPYEIYHPRVVSLAFRVIHLMGRVLGDF